MLPDLHIGFSRGRSGGLVFPSLEEFSIVYVIHTVKGFGIVNKAETDVFLELSCFSHDPADVGNLISGSSAFSKTSLNIWKFTVHGHGSQGPTKLIFLPVTGVGDLLLVKCCDVCICCVLSASHSSLKVR